MGELNAETRKRMFLMIILLLIVVAISSFLEKLNLQTSSVPAPIKKVRGV